VDEGFDVWLGNSRGNMYGMHHTRYLATDPRIWIFDIGDAAKDVKGTISYIQRKTNYVQVALVAHSLGA